MHAHNLTETTTWGCVLWFTDKMRKEARWCVPCCWILCSWF